MQSSLRLSVVLHALRTCDLELYNELKTTLDELANHMSIDEGDMPVGDTLVFIWVAIVLVERYADKHSVEDLRMSFIDSVIVETDFDGSEEFSLALYGADPTEYWEDYGSVYGTVEELYDEITKVEDTYRRGLLAGKLARELNIESDLEELERANFHFESIHVPPMLLLL